MMSERYTCIFITYWWKDKPFHATGFLTSIGLNKNRKNQVGATDERKIWKYEIWKKLLRILQYLQEYYFKYTSGSVNENLF